MNRTQQGAAVSAALMLGLTMSPYVSAVSAATAATDHLPATAISAGSMNDALFAIESNRDSIAARIVDRLEPQLKARSIAPITMTSALRGLRADQLLSASLANTLDDVLMITQEPVTDGVATHRYVALSPREVAGYRVPDGASAFVLRSGVELEVVSSIELKRAPASAAIVVGYFVPGATAVIGSSTGNSAAIDMHKDGTGSGSGSWIGFTAGGNIASGQNSAVTAGFNNKATNLGAFVGAGQNNTAGGVSSLVLGGFGNNAIGLDSLVGAGAFNAASGARSVVVGGYGNSAAGNYSFIGAGGRDPGTAAAAGQDVKDNVVSGDLGAIVGGQGNRVSGLKGFVGGGRNNVVSAEIAVIAGGQNNTASGYQTTIAGGQGQLASTNGASIGGGGANTASGDHSTVSGGLSNTASGSRGTVAGGTLNQALAFASTVAGGQSNSTAGNESFIGGGLLNVIASGAFQSAIGGGWQNTVSINYGFVGAGANNTIGGSGAVIVGGKLNSAGGSESVIGGGLSNTIAAGAFQSAIAGGWQNTASNSYAFIGAGRQNTASGNASVVAGGNGNQATGASSTVGGGGVGTASNCFNIASDVSPNPSDQPCFNLASGRNATVSGGANNQATQNDSSVGGGYQNRATGSGTGVSGGFSNTASGYASVVSGGWRNLSSANQSTVPGGLYNAATGAFTFAAGRGATTNTGGATPTHHQGAFVWSDSPGDNTPAATQPFRSTADNQFAVRARGGVSFKVGAPAITDPTNVGYVSNATDATPGCSLPAGGAASWSCTSDRNTKEAIKAISPKAILAKVASLPLSTWQFKGTERRHLSPMAQDFWAAFGLGLNDKTITSSDVSGVALAAVQGLNVKLSQQIQRKDAEIATMKRELAAIKRKLGM